MPLNPIERWKIIRPYVAANKRDTEISRITGIPRPTVSWTRRKFSEGEPPADKPRLLKYDWPAIQKALDEGLTWRMATETFGCSSPAMLRALRRGDIRPATTNSRVSQKRAGFTVREADLPALREFIETTPIDMVAPGMRRAIERHMPDLVSRLPRERKPFKGERKPR